MKRARLMTMALVIAVIAMIGYLTIRQRRLGIQRTNGYPASPSANGTPLHSHAVFSIGDLFLSYDSSEIDSTLWVVSPAGGFLSMFWPETTRRFNFEALANWNDPGQVVWAKTGRTTVELLIEFSPETNHRLAGLRTTCQDRRCGSTTLERGVPSQVRFSAGNDGSAMLISDKALDWYDSVAELMSDTKTKTVPRLTQPAADELTATAREAALVLTNGESLNGEILEEKVHSKIAFSFGRPVKTSAVFINDGVQFVIDEEDGTQLWDCPWSVLMGDSECSVYTAPAGFPVMGQLTLRDTECGMTISRGERTWLLRRNAKTEELLEANGIVNCANGELMTYRNRRIEYQSPKRQPVKSQTRQVKTKLGGN